MAKIRLWVVPWLMLTPPHVVGSFDHLLWHSSSGLSSEGNARLFVFIFFFTPCPVQGLWQGRGEGLKSCVIDKYHMSFLRIANLCWFYCCCCCCSVFVGLIKLQNRVGSKPVTLPRLQFWPGGTVCSCQLRSSLTPNQLCDDDKRLDDYLSIVLLSAYVCEGGRV